MKERILERLRSLASQVSGLPYGGPQLARSIEEVAAEVDANMPNSTSTDAPPTAKKKAGDA